MSYMSVGCYRKYVNILVEVGVMGAETELYMPN